MIAVTHVHNGMAIRVAAIQPLDPLTLGYDLLRQTESSKHTQSGWLQQKSSPHRPWRFGLFEHTQRVPLFCQKQRCGLTSRTVTHNGDIQASFPAAPV